MKTLHVVDGESAGGTLRGAGFRKNGEILVWRDALKTEPIPPGLTLRHLSRLRSRFWTEGKSAAEFDERDPARRCTAGTKTLCCGLGRTASCGSLA
jgi:hypothetical protein